MSTLAQRPAQQSRWTLASILASCPWLNLHSLAGLHGLLRRLQLGRLRGRDYVHSPDRQYADKVAFIQACRQQVEADPQHYALLYLDEFSFYRQPTLADDYAPLGQHTQPLAQRAYRSNTLCRGLGAVDALTGQLTYLQAAHISIKQLVRFYQLLTERYPDAHTLFVVQDNWSIHFHPTLLAALQPQTWPFPLLMSGTWSALYASPLPTGDLPIQMLFLPSYAPWLNPIEKLWRWLRQDLLHLHRCAHDWLTLKQRVFDFMAQFYRPSPTLLHYLGLLPY